MTASNAAYTVGVDIGGTFTDLCVCDATGVVGVGKVLTTAQNPSEGVEAVLRQTLGHLGIELSQIRHLVHGTTLVTNAILERKGSPTALLATRGFRDAVEIAHERRYQLYDLMVELPRPLAPRHLRFDVPERMLFDGTVEEPLDVPVVERLGRELAENGIEGVAVSFLHAFTNPTHEQQAREALARVAPDLRVSLSSEVVPEIGEFERTSTTLANVYVQEIVDRYLADLEARLKDLGFEGRLVVMLSSGGVATVDTAVRVPVRLLESGPAGGALAAAQYGAASDEPDLLSFDMGGTTAKLCVVDSGEPLVTREFEVDRVYRFKPGSGLPIRTPVIDMIEIGVGGGSVARVNALGLLAVGPESAGANPGPVCYQQGGMKPTVTDADLILGYLDPDYFLGGRMSLDVDAAATAIGREVADPLGLSLNAAAWGIHQIVNEDMANAARAHVVERGHDPRTLPLFAFGGAGPVHGAGIARALGSPCLISPLGAGVMSAAGFLTAPLAFDFVRSRRTEVLEISANDAEALMAEMEAEGTSLLEGSGVPRSAITHVRIADMRFVGQGHEVRVPVPATDSPDWPAPLLHEFTSLYARLYGHAGPTVPVEVLNWRVVSSGPRPTLEVGATRAAARAGKTVKGVRDAYFPDAGGYVETQILDRAALRPGTSLSGPAIIEERESTLVIPPRYEAVVNEHFALVVRPARKK